MMEQDEKESDRKVFAESLMSNLPSNFLIDDEGNN